MELLHEFEHTYQFDDQRPVERLVLRDKPAAWTEYLKKCGFTPHPLKSIYQWQAVRSVIKRSLTDDFDQKISWQRGAISMPTGAGKTLTLFWIVLLGESALYLVNRQDLAKQAQEEFKQLTGSCPAILGLGKHQTSEPLTIALIQTLGRLLTERRPEAIQFCASRKILLVDEGHLITNNSYQAIANACGRATVRAVASGSLLERSDLGGLYMMSTFSDPTYHVASSQYRAHGLLAQVRVFWATMKHVPCHGSYEEVYDKGIIRNAVRTVFALSVAKQAADAGWVTLLLVKRVQHGQLAQELARRIFGHEVPFLCGNDSVDLRKQYLDAMRDESCKVVISSGIFKTGVNVPLIRCLIRLDAGVSTIDSLQIPGRGMRQKETLNWLYLVDFDDQQNRKYLQKASKARLRIYRREEYEIVPVVDPTDVVFQSLTKSSGKAGSKR